MSKRGALMISMLVAGCASSVELGEKEQGDIRWQATSIQGSTVPGGTASIVGVQAGLTVTGGQLASAPYTWLPATLRLSNGARLGTQILIAASRVHDPDLINGAPANGFTVLYDNGSNAGGNLGAANHDIVFYSIWWKYNGVLQALCPNENEAIALSGTWGNPDPVTGRIDRALWAPSSTEITFACTNGVLAKCARWGYKPWTSALGVDLGPLHRACVRAAAADFCANGSSYTTDGTTIDVFDVYGFIPSVTEWYSPDRRLQSNYDDRGQYWSLEATFDEGGGGCIAHGRKATLPPDCRTDYELACELNEFGRPICFWTPTGTTSAIDVADDAGFPACIDDRDSNGRQQLIGIKDPL